MEKANSRQLSDEEILKNYLHDQDKVWIGILFERYAILLLGVCLKYLREEEGAKDAVQQIFLKVLHDIHLYNIRFFKGWIYRVTRNYCLMQLRQGKIRKKSVDVELFSEEIPTLEANSDSKINEKYMENLELAIQKLNPSQQTCIKLFYLNKNSYQEISINTGYSVGQVKSFIQNGKRNLRNMLERMNQI
ncbi:MAG: RNA polymerase sigma factor [Chitinophagaceae bacterium]